MTQEIVSAVLAFAIGSLSPAWIVGRLGRNVDIRDHGSGNAGATNALRVFGWKLALPVLLADVAKGVVATWIPRIVASGLGSDIHPVWLPPICGLLAVVGHRWPVFHGFRGGRGVATAAGVLLVLDPWLFAGAFLVFAAGLVGFRRVGPASAAAALSLVPLLGLGSWLLETPTGWFDLAWVTAMSAIVLWAHRNRLSSP